ncbi:MAG: hypothetical protein J5746_13385 [Victivallales bacterium]|nr:hypothetical protein [Victivallales bacterium]
MRFLCFILLLTLLAFCQELRPYSKTYSQGPLELKVELDRTTAGLEDSIAFTLTAVAPKEYSVAFPDFNKGEILKYLIVQQQPDAVPAPCGDGRVLYQRRLVLEPVIIREAFKIGSFAVGFKKGDETAHEIETEEIPLEISIPEDEEIQKRLDAELKSSKKPYSRLEPPSIVPYVAWPAAVLVALCIFVLLTRYVIRKRREKAALPPPPLPPWVIAQQELDRLMEAKLPEKGLVMEYYNEIQLILRTYIEGRFQIRAPELTTEEFLEKARSASNEVAKYRPQLEQFLTHCDLVRFAAQVPRQQEIEGTYTSCRDFVNATIPAPGGPEGKEAQP